MTGNIRYFNDRAAQCVFIVLVKADKLHIVNNEEISVLSSAIYAIKPHSEKRFRLVAAGTLKYYRNRSIVDLKKPKSLFETLFNTVAIR